MPDQDHATSNTPREPIVFLASQTEVAQAARAELVALHGDAPLSQAGVIVALGGDGFMLETLHATERRDVPVYGMNRGTVGFLMNTYSAEDLPARLAAAQETVLNPLAMRAVDIKGRVHEALAINEVSLLRSGPQAVRLRISVDGRVRWNWSATARCWRRPRARPPTIIRRTGRSCRSAPMSWR